MTFTTRSLLSAFSCRRPDCPIFFPVLSPPSPEEMFRTCTITFTSNIHESHNDRPHPPRGVGPPGDFLAMRHLVVEAEGELAEAARSPVPVRHPPPPLWPLRRRRVPTWDFRPTIGSKSVPLSQTSCCWTPGGGNVKDDLNPLIFKELLVAPHSQATF